MGGEVSAPLRWEGGVSAPLRWEGEVSAPVRWEGEISGLLRLRRGGGMSQMGIKTNSGQLVSVGSLLIVIPNDQQGILRPCSIRYPYAGPSQLTQRINQ